MSKIKGFVFFSIYLIFLVNKNLGQKDDKDEIQKAPPLKPNQLEFAKKFWKELGEEQKKQEAGKPTEGKRGKQKLKRRPGKPKARALVPGGDIQFLDTLVPILFPVGDTYGGIPDSVTSMAGYCIQFVINGLITIAYTTIRWPHKILLKTMIGVGILTFLTTNTLFCLNPLAILNFIKKGSMINKKIDEMADHHNEFKKRLANSMDKYGNMFKIQKHSCCAWFDYKQKLITSTPPGARDFMRQWFRAFYQLHEIIYCNVITMKDAQAWCSEYEFMDMEPSRVLPRSWMTLVIELFVRFF